CGECGHKMVVQYKGGTRYLCNYLRQTHGVPVCQNMPGDPVDAAVIGAFFDALSPLELDAYAQAVAAQQATDRQLAQAQQQQLTPPPVVLPPELKAAFTEIGRQLPAIWDQPVLTRQQKKALLRCLIEKVVIHRAPHDCAQLRIVWQGGDTTSLAIPLPVGS